jgi:hypothetical protein
MLATPNKRIPQIEQHIMLCTKPRVTDPHAILRDPAESKLVPFKNSTTGSSPRAFTFREGCKTDVSSTLAFFRGVLAFFRPCLLTMTLWRTTNAEAPDDHSNENFKPLSEFHRSRMENGKNTGAPWSKRQRALGASQSLQVPAQRRREGERRYRTGHKKLSSEMWERLNIRQFGNLSIYCTFDNHLL